MPRPSSLKTPAPELVLNALRKSSEPLTAYAILQKLGKHGVNSPPIVYRALEALIERGEVHKVKDMAAFVACDCPRNHNHKLSVLTVCTHCKQVKELHDHGIMQQLESLGNKGVRLAPNAVIELPVTCDNCTA